MTKNPLILTLFALAALAFAGCGGSTPEPKTQEMAADDVDPITAIIGEVEVDESILEEPEEAPQAYEGPTLLTVNLRVIDQNNPEGHFTLLDMEGNPVVENGALGVPQQAPQGVYNLEFHTPLVFGSPVFRVEDFQVSGREQEHKSEFPAGQVTLHTYNYKPSGRCVPTRFTVFNEDTGEDVPGRGTSCEPLILEVGNYEVKLHLTKRKYTAVKLPINKGQIRTNKVRLTAE